MTCLTNETCLFIIFDAFDALERFDTLVLYDALEHIEAFGAFILYLIVFYYHIRTVHTH